MGFYVNVSQRGNSFLIREIIQGDEVFRTVKGKPYLFVENKDGQYRTHDGKPVEKKQFDSIAEARKLIEDFRGVEGLSLYGMERWVIPFINDEWSDEIAYDFSKLKILYLDIEVASDNGMPSVEMADKEVTAISMVIGERVLCLGCGDYQTDERLVAYRKCQDEKELLLTFLDIWEREAPAIVSGWNINGFDIPYLVNRITVLFGEETAKRLSPWRVITKEFINFFKKKVVVHKPMGIAVLDYLQVYRKFNLAPQESYTLNNIAHVELGSSKLDYGEYESLAELYRLNYQKFISYNIQDTRLVSRLEKRLHLIELAVVMAYEAKINFEDVLYSSRPWDARIHNYLLAQKIVVPTRMPREESEEGAEEEEEKSIVGGWIKEPIPGLYDFVVSFDVKSEYPNVVVTYGISPDTFIGKIKDTLTIEDFLEGKFQKHRSLMEKKNAALTANMCLYSKSKPGFLPTLMKKLFDQRVEYQRRAKEGNEAEKVRYDLMESAAKVLLNSGFGVLANPYFRWFNPDNAESITTTGQLTVRTAGNAVNKLLNEFLGTNKKDYWIASDTDSVFVNLTAVVEKFCGSKDVALEDKITLLDEFCKRKLAPLLARTFQDLASSLNGRENTISMNRENIADRAVWVAAKNYVLRIRDSKGKRLEQPELKFVGIKAFKPATPAPSRKALESVIKYILDKNQDGLKSFIDTFEADFKGLPIEEISIPKSISGLNKYKGVDTLYKEGVPLQVRGALVFNNMLERLNLRSIAPVIDGDKGRYCYLRLPNPTGENVITIVNALPKKFSLEKYVDHTTMFDKTFMSHVTGLLNAIGWSFDSTLEGLF